MKNFFNINVLILILTLFRYSASYLYYNIEDDDLCSPINKRKIKLKKNEYSGLVINQTRVLNDHILEWDSPYICKFEVTSQKGGIFAVIQHLNLRKDKVTGKCIDYVEFIKKGRSFIYCDQFNANIRMKENSLSSSKKSYSISTNSNERVPIIDNSFIAEDGELDVVIYISKDPLTTEEINGPPLNVGIVFTAYRNCRDIIEKIEKPYKPCGNSKGDRDYCIFNGFFNDSLDNCPFYNCVDEGGCFKINSQVIKDASIGSKVLIGSISSLIVMFVTFIICIWVCRTYRVFCWSDNFANSNHQPTTTPQAPQSQAPRIELNEQSVTISPNIQNPSAPEADKDLPPSYDSLFPDR